MLSKTTREEINIRKYRRFAKSLSLFLIGMMAGILLFSVFIWAEQRAWDYNLKDYDKYYVEVR